MEIAHCFRIGRRFCSFVAIDKFSSLLRRSNQFLLLYLPKKTNAVIFCIYFTSKSIFAMISFSSDQCHWQFCCFESSFSAFYSQRKKNAKICQLNRIFPFCVCNEENHSIFSRLLSMISSPFFRSVHFDSICAAYLFSGTTWFLSNWLHFMWNIWREKQYTRSDERRKKKNWW